MNDIQIAKALGQFPTGNLCNAHKEVRAMHASLAPLFKDTKISGPAKTAKITPGQNAAIHRAVHDANRGDVLVVDGAGSNSFGPFGDILAACCLNQGIAGLVIDSTIRDTADIKEMGFPVFCLGANPTATGKSDLGHVDIAVDCAGVRVNPGDFIVGDDDGVVVVPRQLAQGILKKVTSVGRKEETIKARLAQGETTLEIFEIGLNA